MGTPEGADVCYGLAMSDLFLIKLAQVNPRIIAVTLATAAVILCPDVIRPASTHVPCTRVTLVFFVSVAPLAGRAVRVQTIRLLLSQWDVPSLLGFL